MNWIHFRAQRAYDVAVQRRSMSNSTALDIIRPKSRNDRRTVLKLSAYLLVALISVAGLLYDKKRQQSIREKEWASAVGLVEDARPQLAMQINSERGGTMLYRVEILARYSVDGTIREQWTTLPQMPQRFADAQLQAYLYKGKRLVVRWIPMINSTSLLRSIEVVRLSRKTASWPTPTCSRRLEGFARRAPLPTT